MQVGIPSNQWANGGGPGSAESTQPEAPVAPAPSIPMYIAGLIVTYAGLHAANIALLDPSFSALILGLTLIGFAASYITRRQNIAPRNVELPALIVCVCVVLMAVITDPADSFLAPASVSEDRSKALALLLTWLTVFRSFTLTSDAALLFCCVPTIALIGLVGTATSDPALANVFVLFIAAAVFMMVHENVRQTATSQKERRRSRTIGATAAGWGGQLQATGVCTICAVLVANFVTPFFEAAGSYVRVNSGLATIRMSTDRSAASRTNAEERTELQVGLGPVSLSDEIILKVRAPEAANWRGATFDRYTGTGWRSRQISQAEDLQNAPEPITREPSRPDQRTYAVEESEFRPRARRFHEIDQQVKYVAGSTTQIYAASEARRIAIAERRILADLGGGLRLADPLTDAEYVVRSEIAEMTPAAERAEPGNYPPAINDVYTNMAGMSSDARSKVLQQAIEVTAAVPSAHGKVNALTRWLGAQCKYDTSTPRFPSNRDVVDYFLFESKRGYCDSFATSLAMMCRAIGIPARVASGFLSGELDSAEGVFIVRDKHKHLWTEVYFNGVGWMPFDATALAEDISPAQATRQNRDRGFWATLLSRGWWPLVLLGIAALLLLYVIKVEVIDRYFRPARAASTMGLPETNYAILMEYENACRTLARRGIRRIPTQTPFEFLARARAVLEGIPGAIVNLEELSERVTTYRYSPAVASPSDVQAAQQNVAALSHALRGSSRRRLALAGAAPESA